MSNEQGLVIATQVADLIGWQEPLGRGMGELAKKYLNHYLPEKMAQLGDTTVAQARVKLKNSYLDLGSFKKIIENIGGNPETSRVLFEHTIPSLLSKSSLDRSSSEPKSINMALDLLAKSVANGSLTVMSPLCPPYHYTEGREGLKHASGQILPTIGERFSNSLQSMKETFEPLIATGVRVNFEFYTYTGETGNLEDLVEVGRDVIEHYTHEGFNGLFRNLQSATNDAAQQMRNVLGYSNISSGIYSIEQVWGNNVSRIVKSFQSNFGDRLKLHPSSDHIDRDMETWLRSNLNVSDGWLEAFTEEERKYRQKQGPLITQNGQIEPILLTGLKEGALYLLVTDHANSNGKLILDLETTADYMVKSLRHSPAPVILGEEYSRREVFSKNRIRQPFNIPS